jgi:hypothetical protein
VVLSLEYVTTQEANPVWWMCYMLVQWAGYFGFPWYVGALLYTVPVRASWLAMTLEARLRKQPKSWVVGLQALLVLTAGYIKFLSAVGMA